jgi:hypothetical protein
VLEHFDTRVQQTACTEIGKPSVGSGQADLEVGISVAGRQARGMMEVRGRAVVRGRRVGLKFHNPAVSDTLAWAHEYFKVSRYRK